MTPNNASMSLHHNGMPRMGPKTNAQTGTAVHAIMPN